MSSTGEIEDVLLPDAAFVVNPLLNEDRIRRLNIPRHAADLEIHGWKE